MPCSKGGIIRAQRVGAREGTLGQHGESEKWPRCGVPKKNIRVKGSKILDQPDRKKEKGERKSVESAALEGGEAGKKSGTSFYPAAPKSGRALHRRGSRKGTPRPGKATLDTIENAQDCLHSNILWA